MRKVAIVTGSRADYWLLRPLIYELRDRVSVDIIATGEHLLDNKASQFSKDGLDIHHHVECLSSDDSYLAMTKAISRGVSHFSDTFYELQPEAVILLGDRYETFAAAVASYTLKVPIAHLHGGEVTQGALDDGFRHSISKMASVHFVSHQDYKNRLVRMGEKPESIYTVGAIGLDNMALEMSDNYSEKELDYLPFSHKPYFLLTLHSTTLGNLSVEHQVNSVIKALDRFRGYEIIVTRSNNDPNGRYINEQLQQWSGLNNHVHFIPVLGDKYLEVASNASLVIGNSSSGVLEIPYLNVPVINIGERQQGRVIPKGVFNVEFDAQKISELIEATLRSNVESEKIYGSPGEISSDIANILVKLDLKNYLSKGFYDEAN